MKEERVAVMAEGNKRVAGSYYSASKASTKTSAGWLQADCMNVEHFDDTKFVEMLKKAEEVEIVKPNGQKLKLWDCLKNRPMGLDKDYLNGVAYGSACRDKANLANLIPSFNEENVKELTFMYVWEVVKNIFSEELDTNTYDFLKGIEVPGHYLQCTVDPYASEIAPIPAQFEKIYRPDRAIDIHSRFLQMPESIDAMDLDADKYKVNTSKKEPVLDVRAMNFLQNSVSLVIEDKADPLCPRAPWLENPKSGGTKEEANKVIGGNPAGYVNHQRYFDPMHNPIGQLVTYAVASRTKPFVLSTTNTLTLGVVDHVGDLSKIDDKYMIPVDEKDKSTSVAPKINKSKMPQQVKEQCLIGVKVSKKFETTRTGNSKDPNQVLLEGVNWSMWEILLRFIVCNFGKWRLNEISEFLKEMFRVRLETKRKIKAEKKAKKGEQGGRGARKKDDEEDEEDEEEEKRRNERKGKQGEKKKEEKLFNNKSKSSNASGKRRSGAANEEEPSDSFLSSFAYSDLWDDCRFAIPATHSADVECTPHKLPGDAELLGHGRTGNVYRKTLEGKDCVIKVLILNERGLQKEDPNPSDLSDEMENEWDIYCTNLEQLQGKTVPRMFFYNEVVNGIEVLITEYCGESLANWEKERKLSIIHKSNAIAALDSIHDAGILHGDVALKNFVCKKGTNKVFVIDFGFSSKKEDYESEEKWKKLILEEKNELREILKMERIVKRARME